MNKLKFINYKRYYTTTTTTTIINNNNNNNNTINKPFLIKGLNIENRNELFKLDNELIKKKLQQFKDESNMVIKERGIELVDQLSTILNIPNSTLNNCIQSPFTLRLYMIAANQGISFYHHELRKQITPHDDIERQKRKEIVDKLTNQDLNDTMLKKKSSKKKSLDEKKSMSMEREMELVREQQQEEQHFQQQLQISTKWNMGQLEIQPSIDSFHQDDLFVSFNPYESTLSNSESFSIATRLSKFYWKKDITKWEMFSSSKLNQLIPQLQFHILDKIKFDNNNNNNNNNSIIISQFIDSIKFISNEINQIDLKIFENLNSSKDIGNQILEPIETGENFKGIIANSIVDSLIYIKGHHYRITSEPFITFFQILKENVDYFSSLDKYKQFLNQLLDTLLFDTIVFDPFNQKRTISNEFDYKLKLDILQREAQRQFKVYHNYNTCPDPQRHEEADLRKLSHLCKTFSKRSTLDFIQESKKYLTPSMFSNGIITRNGSGGNSSCNEFENESKSIKIKQLTEGLYTCIPSTITLLDFSISNSNLENNLFDTPNGKLDGISSIDDLIYSFSKSIQFFQRDTTLSNRFLNFITNSINGLNNPIYKLLIELEETSMQLTQENDFDENPIDNWVGGMSIELEEDLEYDETNDFNIVPSSIFKLVKINNHLLSQLHKTFSEDLDLQIQEFEITIKNKKVLEREIKTHNEKLSKLIIDSRNSIQPTLYFIGIQDNQVYTLEISNEWELIWNQLLMFKNGVSLNKFINLQTSVDINTFLTTLTDLNRYGVVGLFPKF